MKQGFGIREQRSGLRLVRKPVASVVVEAHGLREGSTGRVISMLPRIWAVADAVAAGLPVRAVETPISKCERSGTPGFGATGLSLAPPPFAAPAGSPAAGLSSRVEVAFYRKYTEALLRRYMRMSMAAGRVPSLMGRELFRGHVSHYKVTNFEDVVIFCHDIEKCLKGLDAGEKELIRRVALQSYSQGEAAALLGLPLRTLTRQYMETLDKLTQVFLDNRMLNPLKGCQ